MALADVTLTVQPGEVRALVGENGAGKSTLVKLLSGAERPSSGMISVDGVEIGGRGPTAARRAGVRTVHQETAMVPAMSALDNVFLGDPQRLVQVGNRRRLERFAQLSEIFGVSIDPKAEARALSVAERQSLEIMRAVHGEVRVLILDEPTASISVAEARRLHLVVRELAGRGVAVLFISHDLEEVLEISDGITVLRNGKHVATGPTGGWSRPSLIRAMVGREVSGSGERPAAPPGGDAPLLAVDDLRVVPGAQPVALELRAGEILGLAGLVGSGRSTLLAALSGALRPVSGRMVLRGKETPWPGSPAAAIRHGIVLAPEDRKGAGLVPAMAASENMVLPALNRVSRAGLLSRAGIRRSSREAAAGVALPQAMLMRRAGQLSGGNQQKVVLGKWSAGDATVYLIDEPTRGVDVGAKQEIFRLIRSLASAGAAVVLVSSELEEVLDHAHRVLALHSGMVVGEFDPAAVPAETILGAMFGDDQERLDEPDTSRIRELVGAAGHEDKG